MIVDSWSICRVFIELWATTCTKGYSTHIAEFVSTPACHMIASIRFFYPEFAFCTLLISVLLSKLKQLVVYLQVQFIDSLCGVGLCWILFKYALQPVLFYLLCSSNLSKLIACLIFVVRYKTFEAPLLITILARVLSLAWCYALKVEVTFRIRTFCYTTGNAVACPLPLKIWVALVLNLVQNALNVNCL